MILIHPPVVKPSEPPPGLARLAGALRRHRIECRLLDANLEGLIHLLSRPLECRDTRTSRAIRHLPANLRGLRGEEGYRNPERYRQAVLEINQILLKTAWDGVRISFVNYGDDRLSPLRSRDLLMAAEAPERSPFFPYFSDRLPQVIEESRAGLVGFSINFLSQALPAFAMLGFIRGRYPSQRIVLGGGLVASWVSRPGWRNPFEGLVDAVIAGPGEQPLIELLGKRYEEGPDIPDFDELNGGAYFAPGFILPYSASSGCYWRKCAFCPEKAEGNPYRPIPPVQALEELGVAAAKNGPVLVHFLDNAMAPGLLEEIARRGFRYPWYGFVRVTDHLADPGFCLALKRSGCLMLKLGVESGSQEVLDRLEKGADLGIVSRALRAISGAGIGTYCYLLFGTPPEDLERARETLRFVVKHAGCMDFINTAIFNMPLSSPEAGAYGGAPFYEGDLSLYTSFVHPLGWDRPLVRAFLQKEFHRHPAIAAIERRDPPLFTSNHAPFFSVRHG
jgi:hypothetical protein